MLFDADRPLERIAARETLRQSLVSRQLDIYESHRHRVFSVAFYMTGSELAAEDILQQAFIRSFRRESEPDAAGIDNALLQELSHRGLLPDEQPTPVPASSGLPSGGNVLRADLEDAIRALPARERFVFLLTDVEGYSAARIAALLGSPEPSILRTLLTARLRLRAELAALREDPRRAA
jgi:RNA polymerase sigma-70 factor (ECF subfamily)